MKNIFWLTCINFLFSHAISRMSGGYHKRQLLHFALDRGKSKSKEEEKIPALTRHPPSSVSGAAVERRSNLDLPRTDHFSLRVLRDTSSGPFGIYSLSDWRGEEKISKVKLAAWISKPKCRDIIIIINDLFSDSFITFDKNSSI